MSHPNLSAPVDAAQREAIVDALSARLSGRDVAGPGRDYRGYRLVELMAARAGIVSRGLTPDQILSRSAMSSSDFPLLLADAANKVLLQAYTAAAPSYRAWSVKRSFNDFRPHSFVRASDFPGLLPVNEAGEFTHGTIKESAETAQLVTRGRIVSLTRQAIINDDLGAFARLPAAAARAAIRVENAVAYALLAKNSGAGPTMSDGKAMFHTDHGNLAGAGGSPSITTLGAGRAAMRKQTGLDAEPLNISARTLLTGPDLETIAEQLVTSISPAEAANVNPFSGRLASVSDAAISGNAWYLFADTAGDDANFVYGYLDGSEAPRFETQKAFDTDGISFKIAHDFAIGAIDWRFGYRNAGS